MSRIASRRPSPDEYHANESIERYLSMVEGDDVLAILHAQMTPLCEVACRLGTDQIDQRHPPYTWTIRQVFAHVADAERVFGYRMLRFATGDPMPLPG